MAEEDLITNPHVVDAEYEETTDEGHGTEISIPSLVHIPESEEPPAPNLLDLLIEVNSKLSEERARNDERWKQTQDQRKEQTEKITALEKKVSSMLGLGNLITIGTGILASIVIQVARNIINSW